jgi:uncharacterized membrane protein YgcG
MDLSRLIRHLAMTSSRARRAFPTRALNTIEQAIRTAEASHEGELRFVVEGALDGAPLLQGQSARERAIELFARLRVWDTEHNTGVLIYVLLADRRVEIVADRGIHALAGPHAWADICRGMETRFAAGDFEAGAVLGIESVARLLARHCPFRADERNELPDAPAVI